MNPLMIANCKRRRTFVRLSRSTRLRLKQATCSINRTPSSDGIGRFLVQTKEAIK
jgi:hypothetical protein